MTDKISEIRERHLHDERWRNGPSMISPQSHDDRAFLLAEVDRLREENERLRAALSWYADQRNHFPVHHRKPGDPSPAFVVVEEPPIMTDGGTRARNALESKL